MELKNFIVLGAGVSGLTLSYELLKAGQSVKILESLETVGGLARTDTYNGMPLDSGPHLFHSAHEDIINYWRSLVGDNLVEKGFHAGNFQEGKIFDYPVNKETFSFLES